jgi:hypothetical protein
LPLAFQSDIVDVGSGKGRKEIERTVNFGPEGSVVRNAGVALSGYNLDYDSIDLGPFGGGVISTDHHIDAVSAHTRIVGFEGSEVTFRVTCDYRDRNGDDKYGGWVGVTVIADVEPPPGSTVTSESVGHAGLARDASSQLELPA